MQFILFFLLGSIATSLFLILRKISSILSHIKRLRDIYESYEDNYYDSPRD